MSARLRYAGWKIWYSGWRYFLNGLVLSEYIAHQYLSKRMASTLDRANKWTVGGFSNYQPDTPRINAVFERTMVHRPFCTTRMQLSYSVYRGGRIICYRDSTHWGWHWAVQFAGDTTLLYPAIKTALCTEVIDQVKHDINWSYWGPRSRGKSYFASIFCLM